MTASQARVVINGLSDALKHSLLTEHFRPSSEYIFGQRYLHGYYRSYSQKFVKTYPWLVYSPHLDGVFCMYCSLFSPSNLTLGQFVNKPLINWHKG